MLCELLDRWSATGLLYSMDSVHDREAAPVFLDEYEWRPVIAIGMISAAASAVVGGLMTNLVLLTAYLSLSIRAPTFFWILDRYAQMLLIISVSLPRSWPDRFVSSPAVALARLQVCWIYLDAALVKIRSGAWWVPEVGRLSALDVYLRHTHGAAAVRLVLSENALAILSPCAAALEVAAPAALLLACKDRSGSGRWLGGGALGLLAALHLSIAATMSGTVLLGLFALVALLIWIDATAATSSLPDPAVAPATRREQRLEWCRSAPLALWLLASAIYEINALSAATHSVTAAVVSGHGQRSPEQPEQPEHSATDPAGALPAASLHLPTTSSHLKILLGNRWNVFGPADEVVTWEIAPGRLADGTVVEAWRSSEIVSWQVRAIPWQVVTYTLPSPLTTSHTPPPLDGLVPGGVCRSTHGRCQRLDRRCATVGTACCPFWAPWPRMAATKGSASGTWSVTSGTGGSRRPTLTRGHLCASTSLCCGHRLSVEDAMAPSPRPSYDRTHVQPDAPSCSGRSSAISPDRQREAVGFRRVATACKVTTTPRDDLYDCIVHMIRELLYGFTCNIYFTFSKGK